MPEAAPEDGLLAGHDSAILLLGFASGCEGARLSALDVGDQRVEEGVDVLIRRSGNRYRCNAAIYLGP